MGQVISDSQFNMWRAIVALVHADGQKHEEEEKFLEQSFNRISLSEEQKNVLMADLHESQDVALFFSKITAPRDRSQFIYFARLLFWCDGSFDAQEQEIFKRLTDKVMSKVDLEKTMRDVEDVSIRFYKEEEAKKKDRPLREKLTDALLFWEKLY
jgi:uncharacterized membrane protein YebE (DUF533 family)